MKKIIFIQSHNGGRLANQLWNFISIYAYCLEKGYILINPTFDQYSRYFEQFKNNSLLSPNIKFNILNKNISWFMMNLFLKMNRFIGLGRTYQTGEDSNAIILPPTDRGFNFTEPVGFFNGWLFRNKDGLEKFKSQVKHAFRPSKEYEIKLDKFLKTFSPKQFKVAIHIRRTDYKTHLDGQYYFEIEDYKNVIRKIEKKFSQKKLVFIICSDEPRSLSEFADIQNEVILSPFLEDFVVDLFLISECDLIVGPPSSFTQFAAWIGEKQLKQITDMKNFTL